MVQTSHTAVLEQNETYREDFVTEPYEVGWAREARWYLRVLDGSGTLTATPQISPDGLHWCDLDATTRLTVHGPELASLGLSDFGAWLRLDCRLTGDQPWVKVLVYLQLKG